MSDRAREVIAEALWRADVGMVDERGLTWTRSPSKDHYRELAAAIPAALEQAGIVLVELPQPCKDVWEESDIALFPTRDCTPVRVRWSGEIISGSEWLDPEDARALAAALLAAANRAERAE